ncbi:wax ester synthase/diacylglycerol acyltransferase 11-like [Euphorbia lathyris]|uniref:wax ester synthase/diacylglycerol acyltransferase 11-like n=1 Tax=Euphorbia lathyris TaxID=212925 RepID=UPI0033138912
MDEKKKGLKWRKPHLQSIQIKGSSSSTTSQFKEEEEFLSPSSRLLHEPNFNLYIIAISGLKTPIDPQIVKSNLPHTLLKHPRFSSLQVVDEKDQNKMKWVKTQVDLENHIVVPKLDENIENTDKWVEDYIHELSKTTITMSQPLWDMHLLNLKTKDAESVGVLRAHHSLGDGTSLMSLLLACTRQTSDPNALPTIPTAGRSKMKRAQQLKNGRFERFVMGIWWFVGLVLNTVIDVLMFIATTAFWKDTETPLKGGDGVEFTPRRFVWRNLSLDDFKLVKNAMNATINDVALGATQAGLSRYLNRKYGEEKMNEEEEASEVKNNLPKNIRLRATLLINIRPVAGIQALADMMEKDTKAKWGNWIGYVLLPITIAIKDDPLDYVREAKSTVDRKKHSLEAFFTFCIADIFLKLFGIKKASGLSHRAIHNTTMCFSNLVGPQEELTFYGHQLAYIAPSSYNQPHALMINFQSYAQKMSVVVSVDEGTIPDPHQLIDDIVVSFNLIKQAAISSPNLI